ncbi:MAG: glycosyltransferase family 2 protein [Proteobacteria bacterium]|nr:glycosyltransferase family 2 protein [Pseudomonadota bacterium]
MIFKKTIAVVIPAHNEEKLIAKSVEQVPEFVDYIIVVDDASTDGTLEALKSTRPRPGLRYLKHEVNRGVGGAIVTGYKQALELDAEVVVVMAGDAQMDPMDLLGLLKPVIYGNADYVKGDRLSWPGVSRKMPPVRFVGNHILTLMTRLTSGYRDVRDSQCGYTAVSAKMLSHLDLNALYQRYGFPNDMLAHLNTWGARVEHVPVRPIYASEKSGISLFTACFRVPGVLIRSLFQRRRREQSRKKLIENPSRALAIPAYNKRQ